MRKIFVFCLVVVFSFMVVWEIPKREAKANPLLVVGALARFAAPMLLAAGAQFATKEALEAGVDYWYSNAGQEVRISFANAVDNVVNSVLSVPNNVWQSVQQHVNNNYVVGECNICSYGGYELHQPLTSFSYYINQTAINYFLSENSNRNYIYISESWRNDGYSGCRFIASDYPLAVYIDSGTGDLMMISNITQTTDYNGASFVFNADVPILVCNDCVQNYFTTISRYYSAVGEQIVTIPGYDYINEENRRDVAVPNALDELVGKGSADVQNPVYNPSQPITEPSTETGWLQGIWNSITSLPTSIYNTFTANPAAINLEPLKLVGTEITNKFPFSLPWDFLRSFEEFEASGFNPVMTINLGSHLGNVDMVLDFSMFSNIVEVVRKIELVLFDIGLIMITRKLLGGSV
ncbi:MAG: hypothetical protein A4E55_00117 [Pelotomaculum sp. PtaU1.Bin035]|nr:MAG: hypothetical protein A4E55_00117 [Pelotomaculum sp. PtaU1.Bin035]